MSVTNIAPGAPPPPSAWSAARKDNDSPVLEPLHEAARRSSRPAEALWLAGPGGGRPETLLAAGEVGILNGPFLEETLMLGLQLAVTSAREDHPKVVGLGMREAPAVFGTRRIELDQIESWAQAMSKKSPQSSNRLLFPKTLWLQTSRDHGQGATPEPSGEWMAFWNEVKSHSVGLVVLDVMDYLHPSLHLEEHTTVALIMDQIRRAARKTGCAVLLVTEMNPTQSPAWAEWHSRAQCVLQLDYQPAHTNLDLHKDSSRRELRCVRGLHLEASLPQKKIFLRRQRDADGILTPGYTVIPPKEMPLGATDG